MIPPINGMHAIAAATFDGKPVDADFAVSGSGLGGGGGDVGWLGSPGSGMIYIRKLIDGLSSNLARHWLSLPSSDWTSLWWRVNQRSR
jgi:hypothetical protein